MRQTLQRYALGYAETGVIAVDICPFCSGPHLHPMDGMSPAQTDWGNHWAPCGKGRRYKIANGMLIGGGMVLK